MLQSESPDHPVDLLLPNGYCDASRLPVANSGDQAKGESTRVQVRSPYLRPMADSIDLARQRRDGARWR
jgi:hypothetical protein